MSWISELYKTYEYLSKEQEEGRKVEGLLPVAIGTQNAHIEVRLAKGVGGEPYMVEAKLIEKRDMQTAIPITEKSAARTSSPVPHPVFDNLMYLAGDFEEYNGEKLKDSQYENYFLPYLRELEGFAKENEFAMLLFQYLKEGCLIQDLVEKKVIVLDEKGKMDAKTVVASTPQNKFFLRFSVDKDGENVKLWEDMHFLKEYSKYYLSKMGNEKGLCYVSGIEKASAGVHGKNIRYAGDGCKLISSNDKTNYTFRGRFENPEEACMVSYAVSEKAHNALKYLIRKQGYIKNDYTVLSWSIEGKPPSFMGDSEDLLEEMGDFWSFIEDPNLDEIMKEEVETNQDFALKLKRVIKGYKEKIDPNEKVNVMILDSANLGRMAILYYSEKSYSEYLEKIKNWHEEMSWFHRYSFKKQDEDVKQEKKKSFWGAPSAYHIVLYAFGVEQNGLMKLNEKSKFINQQLQRLLPCIVDGASLPKDFMNHAFRNATNPQSMSYFNWYKSLGVACSLIKKYYLDRRQEEKERYEMKIDNEIRDRSYLYGRLLAVAERVESVVLYKNDETRQTNARKYMSSFTNKPYTTWLTIHHNLQSYLTKLSPGSKKFFENEIEKITALFEREDYKNNARLEPEFLLSFYSQLEEYRKKEEKTEESEKESD